jgi:hypothetical protein
LKEEEEGQRIVVFKSVDRGDKGGEGDVNFTYSFKNVS